MKGRRFKTKNKNTLPDTLFKTKIVKKQKNHKVGNAQKVIYDGIQFQSGLEKNMYIIFVENGFTYKKDFFYESGSVTLIEKFDIDNEIWIHRKSDKSFIKESSKVRPCTYKPDFSETEDLYTTKWIVESKGMKTDRWNLTYKLFKIWLKNNNPNCKYYLPSNKSECEITIKKILELEVTPKI